MRQSDSRRRRRRLLMMVDGERLMLACELGDDASELVDVMGEDEEEESW